LKKLFLKRIAVKHLRCQATPYKHIRVTSSILLFLQLPYQTFTRRKQAFNTGGGFISLPYTGMGNATYT
jgi:hypothetical protein